MKRPRPTTTTTTTTVATLRPTRRPRPLHPPPDQPPPAHPFFDRLPEDALIHIIRRLATHPAPTPAHCPVLALARASTAARRAAAATVGARLAFSVYATPDWFHAWLAVAGPALRDLALHNRSSRSAGDVRHLWPAWPRRPVVHLHASPVLRAVHATAARLVDLDVSGLQVWRRTGIGALEALLRAVRGSLRCLKIDLGHFRLATAVERARLVYLRRLTVANLGVRSEGEVLGVLRSMRRHIGEEVMEEEEEEKEEEEKGKGKEGDAAGLRELMLDACDSIPSVFLRHRGEMERLLSRLELFHIDYDDELEDFWSASSVSFEKLSAAATLPSLQRICFSGSGVPVTPRLVSEIRAKCALLTELRLVDCDVDPSERPAGLGRMKARNEALTCTGTALTHYYPRWVTFKLAHLDTLAKHCPRLTHLRIFTAPGVEESLNELGMRLGHCLVDLEVYPKKHERKREIASAIVRLVQHLHRLERLCLVTLDLSSEQLQTVLQHCGDRLKLFSFSPAVYRDQHGEHAAECIAGVLVCAAMHNHNLQRVECILPNETVPVVKTERVARRLWVAMRLLESRAARIELANITSLVSKMTAAVL